MGNIGHLNKINDELTHCKHENVKLKREAMEFAELMNEIEGENADLIEENEQIKKQIFAFQKQLKRQSVIQNEIIDIQKRLTDKKNATQLVSTSSCGSFLESADGV